MDKMQEEAMRRVREMQSSNHTKSTQHRSNNQKPPEQVSDSKSEMADTAESKNRDPLSDLFKDKEKLLVLLLIMLLSQESSNTELVLALLYIII